jgi:hypothetical protein
VIECFTGACGAFCKGILQTPMEANRTGKRFNAQWMARDMVLRHNCLWIVVNPYFCKREVSRLPPCPRSARHSPVYSVRVLISIMETSNGLSPIL